MNRTTRSILAGIGSLVAAIAATCFAQSAPAPELSNPINWGGDGFLPFPCNTFTRGDTSSPTGLRLRMPDGDLQRKIFEFIPIQTQGLAEGLMQKDGFSPNYPIVISVPGVLKPVDVPAAMDSTQADASIALYHAATRERVPYRVFLDVIRKVGGPNVTILRIYPLTALEKGARFVAMVRTSLRPSSGRILAPSRGWAEMSSAIPPGDPLKALDWQRFEGVRTFLAEDDIDPNALFLAFDFTIESDESYTRTLVELRESVRSLAPSISLVPESIEPRPSRTYWDAAETVKVEGRFRGADFIDHDGRRLPEPEEKELPFKLLMPRNAVEGGFPVVVFGHGFMVNKDTMFQVAGRLVKRGFAVIGVDAPFHHTLFSPVGVVLRARNNMDLIGGMLYQDIARQLMLLHVVRSSDHGLGDLDILPLEGKGPKGDGRPDLDPTRVVYIGQSMGGMAGTSVLALDSELLGGVLNVAGGTYGDFFEESFLVEEIGLPIFAVKGLSRMESYIAAGFMGYATDGTDPAGVAPYITRNRFLNPNPKPVMVQAGFNDGIVPNGTTNRLARALGVPAVRPLPVDVPFIEAVDRPFNGPGLYYYKFGQGSFLPHVCLMGDEAASDAVEFLAALLRE